MRRRLRRGAEKLIPLNYTKHSKNLAIKKASIEA
jgi:hypothetical protein